jgi:sialic acid synthase SpsE
MEIKLEDDRFIGEQHPCYIIMDVGANHNMDLNTSKKLIESAAKLGADAIKFQIYQADKLYSKNTPKFKKDPLKPYNMIKKYELPRKWLPILKELANENKIDFSCSPFDYEAVDLLDELGIPFFKIASPEIVDLELIEYIAKKKKPIIFSTGMAKLEDIEDALSCIKKYHQKIIILHCNTLYPTPVKAVNLRAIQTLQKLYPYPIGFSDHTLGTHISLAAVAMGAKVIERHFTLDKSQEGPDHSFALEPNNLSNLIKFIREIEEAMGDGIKRPHKLEKENFKKARRSIIALKKIPKNRIISRDMLIIKRPGYGIKPKFIDIVVGRKVRKDIEKDQWITWEMI